MKKILGLIGSGSFRILLFLSSYIPLFLILLIQNIDNLYIALFILTLIILPFYTLYRYIKNALEEEPNHTLEVNKIFKKGSESLNYISGYIIPFISVNASIVVDGKIDFTNLFSILILFFVIASIYMSSNLYYINPILNILYNIDEIEDDNNDLVLLISNKKTKLKKNSFIAVRELSPGIYYYEKLD